MFSHYSSTVAKKQKKVLSEVISELCWSEYIVESITRPVLEINKLNFGLSGNTIELSWGATKMFVILRENGKNQREEPSNAQ